MAETGERYGRRTLADIVEPVTFQLSTLALRGAYPEIHLPSDILPFLTSASATTLVSAHLPICQHAVFGSTTPHLPLPLPRLPPPVSLSSKTRDLRATFPPHALQPTRRPPPVPSQPHPRRSGFRVLLPSRPPGDSPPLPHPHDDLKLGIKDVAEFFAGASPALGWKVFRWRTARE